MENILDYQKVLNKTLNKHELSVTLKQVPGKGVGIFATKPIYKGNVIAFYKLKVFETCNYVSPTNGVYSCYVYSKKGTVINYLIGDLYNNSVQTPVNGIPYWGYFANEPSERESSNCELHTKLKYNYRDKSSILPGDNILYELRATRYIAPGQEVLWHYGDSYNRNYVASKL